MVERAQAWAVEVGLAENALERVKEETVEKQKKLEDELAEERRNVTDAESLLKSACDGKSFTLVNRQVFIYLTSTGTNSCWMKHMLFARRRT
jgi:hypothetical protein